MADHAKGLNPNEVNEIVEEYKENQDPEIYDFLVNILVIQLSEEKSEKL